MLLYSYNTHRPMEKEVNTWGECLGGEKLITEDKLKIDIFKEKKIHIEYTE